MCILIRLRVKNIPHNIMKHMEMMHKNKLAGVYKSIHAMCENKEDEKLFHSVFLERYGLGVTLSTRIYLSTREIMSELFRLK